MLTPDQIYIIHEWLRGKLNKVRIFSFFIEGFKVEIIQHNYTLLQRCLGRMPGQHYVQIRTCDHDQSGVTVSDYPPFQFAPGG